ncbi:Acetyltransferase involved in cellulose biosynthesis, CelD/BcsL family [Faunimonas pinastri]|uniref:Acetyltransferase involved in cellulose biosynthesis, CelD/BcsL family n=1 Tax=Faunimonas pinastri TaxID=1855383 RepID=A0A1H9MFY0_9HYPH|nr:GNAT family N-acetyltransferase [Faunimonas pinastri]SER22582.1 Acetyltransferase involved in cellulose biosynthesis, CelD/BcsL family [Faunimonas pinastri]
MERSIFDVIREPRRLAALQAEWDDLFRRAPGAGIYQSFNWCWTAWETMFGPAGARLCCLVLRRADRLVLAWPFAIVPYHRFWSVARQLGSPGDYPEMLVDGGPDRAQLAELAWAHLRKTCSADLVLLEHVRSGSLLGHALQSDGARPRQTEPAPYVDWNEFPDFATYWRSRGKSFRGHIDRRQRRLQELGPVSFSVESHPEAIAELFSWLLLTKRDWLARRRQAPAAWMQMTGYPEFLRAVQGRLGDGAVKAFTLKLGERILAVHLSLVDDGGILFLHPAYDTEFLAYTPGSLLHRHTLAWACERSLNFDFLWGGQDYKQRFANRNCDVFDTLVPVSPKGKLFCRLKEAQASATAELLRHNVSAGRAWLASRAGRIIPANAGRTPPTVQPSED